MAGAPAIKKGCHAVNAVLFRLAISEQYFEALARQNVSSIVEK